MGIVVYSVVVIEWLATGVVDAGNSRSDTESVLRRSPFSNPFLFVATATALGIHVADNTTDGRAVAIRKGDER